MRYDAIILGLSGTGLAVARALGRRGLRVAGVDPRPWEIGHKSRYVISSTDASLAGIAQLAGDNRPVLLACGDPELRWVFDHAKQLAQWVRLPSSFVDGRAARVLNKRLYYADCLRLGIPIARTWIPDDESDLKSIIGEARFPVLIKPLAGRVVMCPTGQSLRRLVQTPQTVVVQERLPGPEHHLQVFAGHRGEDGGLGPTLTASKLRQYPRDIGSGSRLLTTEDPEVAERSIELLHALRLTGPCGMEWKRVGNQLIHIETNPRPVLWYALAEAVSWDAWCELNDTPRPPAMRIPAGVMWSYCLRDLAASRFRDRRRSDVHCLQSSDDPLPGCFAPVYAARLWSEQARGQRHPSY